MRINHNIAALNTHRQLTNNTNSASKSLEKLSSGLRINRAGDDAAGLAISEKMRSQIRGLEMAMKNSQDSISLIQTAEGAMNEVHSILQRMRELAVQAVNDTNTEKDREELQKEINQLTSEINRIGNTTEFNEKKLLNGDLSASFLNGSTTTTTTSFVSEKVSVQMAIGVDNSGVASGNIPTFTSEKGTNTIAFGATDNIDWSALDTNETNTVTVTKTANGLKVEIEATDTNGDAISVTDEYATVDKDGNYVYDAHGVSFTISKADFEAMDDNDAVVIDLNPIVDATLDPTDGVGTKNDWTQNVDDGTNGYSDAAFTDGINIDGTQLMEGAASLKIEFDDASGAYTVSILDKDGTALSEDVITPNDPTSFSYNNHGISFEITHSDAVTLEYNYTFKTETTTTTSEDRVDKSLVFQTGSNENQTMTLAVEDIRAAALGIVGTGDGFTSAKTVTNGTDSNLVESALDITTSENAAKAITVIDDAIKAVSSERSKLGAVQNRLEHTINNLGTSAENLTAAESRIRDVDMAKEMMNFTKDNILTQAAQAMLAQANQQPQGVLQLLR